MATYRRATPRWAGPARWGPRRRVATATATAIAGLALLVLGPAATAVAARVYLQQAGGQESWGAPIGTEVRDGAVGFVVHTVRCGEVGTGRATHGRLCEITLAARNHGPDLVTIPTTAQKLAGPEGTRHLPSTAEPALFGSLAPGEAATATVHYDLPPGAAVTHLELHGGPYTAGQAVEFAWPPLPLLPD